MASGGVDPDQDVRMVVLPPPYMVESLASGQVDAFCVGAPWNSVAVSQGVGHILHFGSELQARLAEKVLALRQSWAEKNSEVTAKLLRALSRAADFVDNPENSNEIAGIISPPRYIGVDPELVHRTLRGDLKVSSEGEVRNSPRYIIMGNSVTQPDPIQAGWLYAQMVRWGHAPLSADYFKAACSVFRPDIYESVLGNGPELAVGEPADHIGAFAGEPFDANDIMGHVSSWKIRRW
jgi:NitT/TauT family transport system ATP-binding protein